MRATNLSGKFERYCAAETTAFKHARRHERTVNQHLNERQFS